jgi:hypothetical protein
VKKWLQLRNRDTDHRSQVEERRRKREEEAKAKIDDLLRREKERQQRVNHNRTNKPDTIMSMSTDIISTRRAISASRLRSNHPGAFEENSTVLLTSHQLNSIDEQQNDHSIDESSVSSSAKPMQSTSFVYWLNTGDYDNNHPNSTNFMRSTYAATCRSHLSHSIERCPRAGRAREDGNHPPTLTNGESQRRITNGNRPQVNETIRRLAKPKNIAMAQSIHVTTSSSAAKGLPLSRSSHQIRLTTPSVTTTSTTRRHTPSRPATVPTSNNQSRTSPSDESSSVKPSSQRPKVPSSSTKPPTFSARSKPPIQRSIMTTSRSSSSLSSSTITSKRPIGAISPSKSKPSPPPPPLPPPAAEPEPVIDTTEEETVPVNEESIDTLTEMTNPAKREPVVDEQEYQRKLNQKIREAQQRLELERQREEERKRQLELEEFEREQEQIRLVEEQRRVEQERLQRAIEERERENELKRQEEQRLQQQREEIERRQAEETERLNRERQERAKKEEEERNERKKRLDLIMRRTRQISPNSKENNTNKPVTDQTNGHDSTNPITSSKSSIPHSISDTRFPTSASTDNFLIHQDSIASSMISSTTDTPKFKSPLIQSLLNKARNTRSTDNLVQTSMTASQIMVDESQTAAKSTDLSDDDHNSNGHPDLHLTSSYHDRPIEATAGYQ